MHYSGGQDTKEVSDLASARGHEGTRTNRGSRIVYIRETCAPASSEHANSMTFGLAIG